MAIIFILIIKVKIAVFLVFTTYKICRSEEDQNFSILGRLCDSSGGGPALQARGPGFKPQCSWITLKKEMVAVSNISLYFHLY